MPTAADPSGRTLRRLVTSAGMLHLDADVRTLDDREPHEVRGVELPAEVNLP